MRYAVAVVIVGLAGIGVIFGVASLSPGCGPYCAINCLLTICPIDPSVLGDRCKCERECPAGLMACSAGSDCIVVESYCCDDTDITHPFSINATFAADWVKYRAAACTGEPEEYKNVPCLPACSGQCQKYLKAPICDKGVCRAETADRTVDFSNCMRACSEGEPYPPADAGQL